MWLGQKTNKQKNENLLIINYKIKRSRWLKFFKKTSKFPIAICGFNAVLLRNHRIKLQITISNLKNNAKRIAPAVLEIFKFPYIFVDIVLILIIHCFFTSKENIHLSFLKNWINVYFLQLLLNNRVITFSKRPDHFYFGASKYNGYKCGIKLMMFILFIPIVAQQCLYWFLGAQYFIQFYIAFITVIVIVIYVLASSKFLN